MSNFRLLPYFVCFATGLSLVKVSTAPFNNFENDLGDRRDGQLARTSTAAIDIRRLSDGITPTAYVLRLVPDLSKFTFFGKVEISIRTKLTTNQISIHSKNLTIKSVTVQLKADTPGTQIPNNHEFDETNDLLIIKTATTQPLIFGTEYTLVIEFEGEIGENLVGFYRSSYVFNDTEFWLATTEFYPNHARQAFPCFDEPRFRTPFTIYIARNASQLAWSNIPPDSLLPSDSISGADRRWQKFKTSPPMPTYLVSYMISDFSYVPYTENLGWVVAIKNANTGYPLITVPRSYENGKTEISQSPYRASAAPERVLEVRWVVPLYYITSSVFQSWSFADELTELQETLPNTDWIPFYLQHASYRRFNYEIENWNLLIDQLQKDHQKIPVLNRAQLISDAYALAYDEHLTYHVAIKLTEYLPKETDMIPWYAAIKAFDVLRFKLQSTTGDTFFKKYLYDLVKKSYETIGFEIKSTDSDLVKIVKPLYLMLACNLEIEECIQKSLEEYKTNEADLTKIQPDVKPVVYCHALRKSADQPTVFNNLWATYTKYDIPYEKQQILTALTCATDEEIIKRILSKIIDPQNKEIRYEDGTVFLNSLISRPPAITASLKFIGEKIATISQLNDNGVQLLNDLFNWMTYSVQTQDQIQQLKELETKFASLDQNKYAEFTWIVKKLLLRSEKGIRDDVQKLDRIHKEYLKSSETKSETNPDTKILLGDVDVYGHSNYTSIQTS